MFSSRRPQNGFTLIELVVVVIIIGVVAVFAVPNYAKAVDKSKARNILINLTIIAQAQDNYKLHNGSYFLPGGIADVNAINTALGLSIVAPPDTLYMCSSALLGPPGGCSGILQGGEGWTYGIQPGNGWQPFCASTMGGHPCPL